MSDYTPTTEDVQFNYAMHMSVVNSRLSEDGKGTLLGVHFDEFDRWLAAHDAEVRASLLAEQGAPEAKLKQLLADMVDPDPCWFDHHGGCQAHGYLSLEPGDKCPHQEAKELLSRLPVEENRPETMTACCTTSDPCEKHKDARHQEVPESTDGSER